MLPVVDSRREVPLRLGRMIVDGFTGAVTGVYRGLTSLLEYSGGAGVIVRRD
jgi:hypothetical protein